MFFLPGRSSILPVPKNTCSFGGRLVGRLCVEQGDLPTRQVSVERPSSRCLCWQDFSLTWLGLEKIINNSCIYIYTYHTYMYIICLFDRKFTSSKGPCSIAMLVYQRIICDERIHPCAVMLYLFMQTSRRLPLKGDTFWKKRNRSQACFYLELVCVDDSPQMFENVTPFALQPMH